jgi:hypothetical protein
MSRSSIGCILMGLPGREKTQGVKRGRRVFFYFPGGWQADMRELPGSFNPDRFAWF